MPTFHDRDELIMSRLVFLLGDQAAPIVDRLQETKHIASHRQLDRWDRATRSWSHTSRARRDRATIAAAAAAASQAGGLSRRLMMLLALADKYVNEARSAEERSKKLKGPAAFIAQQEHELALRKFRAALDRAKTELQQTYRKNFRAGMQAHGVSKRAVTGEDKRWVDSAAKKEGAFFTGLVRDMVAGKSVTSLAPRVDMYGRAAMGAFFAGQVVAAGPNEEIHWVVDPTIENCPDCLELESRGPYTRDTLPTQPGAGATRCRSNCGCRLVFEPVSEDEAGQIASQGVGKGYLLRRLTGPRAGQRKGR